MPPFTKPTTKKLALKLALYGPAGSGKTFTSLLLAEGLSAGKKVALVDTEAGSAFYAQTVPAREHHPQAFDFEVLSTRSVTEVLAAISTLEPAEYGVLVIDSITHLWDRCLDIPASQRTRQGTIPFPMWAAIKKPYRALMDELLRSPLHVLICGRQAVDYGVDETTGAVTSRGYRLRAEGETGYEPDVLLRLEQRRVKGNPRAVPTAVVEKDRTGVLAGRTIAWPNFENIAQPLLGLLSPPATNASANYLARIEAAESKGALDEVGQDLAAAKEGLDASTLATIRRAYAKRQAELVPVS